MAPAPKSSPDWRGAYSTLNSTAFRGRASVGGNMGDSQPLAHIACLGRRIRGPDAMAAPTVVVACPGVGRRRGGKRVCAGFRAQTRSGLGRTRPAGTPTP